MRAHHATGILLALFLVIFGSGCFSRSSGTSSLNADKANQIQKGVTTKAEVISMFGPPANITMLPGGKRVMSYYFSQSDTHSEAQSFIPVVNMFASKADVQTNTRTLQVNLNASDVVEDYQYNDNTSKTEATGGLLGESVKSVPTSNPREGN